MIINCMALKGENMECIEEANLQVDGGYISGVSDGFETGALDYRKCIAVPGLINAHTHIGDSFAKEACAGLGVSSAVGSKGLKWRFYEKAGGGEVLGAMKKTVGFMLKTGTTTFADFREQGSAGVAMLKDALKGSPINPLILGRDIPIEECDGLGLNTYQINQIPKDRKGRIVAIHAGERKGEIGKALGTNPDVIVHFTKATKSEMEKASKKKVGIVSCPRANAYLRAGAPRIQDMLDAGLNVALGSDNVMINSPNMWREMEFAYKQSQLSGGLSAKEVLKMATANPARIFHLKSGVIQKGRQADIVFIDTKSENLDHNKDIVSALVNRTEPSDIKKIMINGVFAK